jgi:hypothetical protein
VDGKRTTILAVCLMIQGISEVLNGNGTFFLYQPGDTFVDSINLGCSQCNARVVDLLPKPSIGKGDSQNEC